VTGAIVAEIKMMTKNEAETAIGKHIEARHFTHFKLGGVLSRIRREKWFEGHKNFGEFAQNYLGMKQRKADYLADTYDRITKLTVPLEKFSGLHWSKLREIARVVTNENADYWIDKAQELPHHILVEEVKAASKKQDKAHVTLMKLTPDIDEREVIEEAIEKAKDDVKTPHDATALEHICSSYLDGMEPSPTDLLATLDNVGKKDLLIKLAIDLGLEEACACVNDAFPNANFILEGPESFYANTAQGSPVIDAP